MSWAETFFGLGYSIGPVLGSFLYQVGGFSVPFLVVGGVGLVTSSMLLCAVPKVQANSNVDKRDDNHNDDGEGKGEGRILSVKHVLRVSEKHSIGFHLV